MSRFLFVVPPLAGHVNPTIGVAAALVRRRHEVAWAGLPAALTPLVGADARVYPCAAPPADPDRARAPESRGPAALKYLWESFLLPLAEAMAPGVEAAVAAFAPDVLVVDQQAVAGAIVGDRTGTPWATAATTSAELTDPLAGLPKIGGWLRDALRDLQVRWGAPADRDPRFSPHLVLVFSTEELARGIDPAGRPLRFVGPSIATRPATVDFPWDWLDATRPTVLVTLGTVNGDAGGRFLAECRQALAARPGLRAVLVDPADPVGHTSEDLLIRPYIPQLAVLPQVRAVICHAGHNTVCEALFHGVPLVVAPIRDDQPVVAAQVAEAGAGVRLRFARATATQIGAALDAVLTEPAYRDSARRIQRSFQLAGGGPAAAAELASLARATAAPTLATQR